MKLLINILFVVLITLFFNITDVVMFKSHKRVAEKVWQEYCTRGGLALNDCNWCHCDHKLEYACSARVCSEVDMFGHFNDAIKEVDVGMEGHGVWRSSDTACKAGIHYRKGELLCVCTEENKWPSPVCRDVFQVLYSVEKLEGQYPNNQTCSPTKLYQFGCNTCYCPESGSINSSLCTRRNCSDDVASSPKLIDSKKNIEQNNILAEIYAACERAKKYQIGCQTCVCLPSNRLLCDNCTSVNNFTVKMQDETKSFCSGKIAGRRFKKDCNICFCDQKDIMYCTVLKCLESDNDISVPEIDYELVDAPVDDPDCVPGTKYTRDCNTCNCFMLDGVKHFGCTIKKCETCANQTAASEATSCVEGTRYEKKCLICQCLNIKGEQSEFCTFNDKCRDDEKNNEVIEKLGEPRSLDSLHGYCEPLHIYDQDCNKCRCLTDGSTVSCTSKICSKTKSLNSMVVEFIPFIQKQNVCPAGYKYKVDCNLCYCMSNGNALCTTKVCTPKGLKVLGDYFTVLFIDILKSKTGNLEEADVQQCLLADDERKRGQIEKYRYR